MKDAQGSRGGRAAVSNRSGRFEPYRREAFDDGWGALDEPITKIETKVVTEHSRRVISTNDSPDLPFTQSINPYRGCEHGCIYCYARPTHAYLGLSPGLDFESRIIAKPDAPERLRDELSRRGYVCEPIAVGANTDPYQPAEGDLGLTRKILEVLADFNHPVVVVTKSNMVLRDIDILAPMARQGLAAVHISLTSLDRKLARRMEPRAPTPARRLDAIRGLSQAGIPVGLLVSPVVPGLNDAEVDAVLSAGREAGAICADYILLRLPGEVRALFEEWLDMHYPLRKKKVISLLSDAHEGQVYRSEFGVRMRGSGNFAHMLQQTFDHSTRRHGLDRREVVLHTDLFAPPKKTAGQLALF